MGTRADFYIGQGKAAVWLGSVAYDGYQWDEDKDNPLYRAKTQADYMQAVADILKRDDGTTPDDGWPWPWDNSGTTDYAYHFADGKTQWLEDDDWPDMSDKRNMATIGSKRSGIMLVG